MVTEGRGRLPAFLVFALIISIVLHVWGIMADLPQRGENDEGCFIAPAIRVALFRDLNPEQFINPGSTVIYPAAAVYTLLDATTFQGRFFAGAGGVPKTIWDYINYNPVRFHLPVRLISLFYSILCIPVFYLLTRKTAGETTANIAVMLFAVTPLIINYGHVGRTDTAALFFSMLCLWQAMRMMEDPTRKNQILAGVFAGLGVSSRYFMVVLMPCLVAASIMTPRGNRLKSFLTSSAAMVLSFCLTSPFVVADYKRALADLSFEASSQMLGSDGLSPLGNFWYYLSEAIPQTFYWPMVICILAGFILVCFSLEKRWKLLLIFAGTFLIAISANARHWARWIIPLIPILVILASYAIARGKTWLQSRLEKRNNKRAPLLATSAACACVSVIALLPLNNAIADDIAWSRVSTEVDAGNWIDKNIPPGSGIIQDMDLVRIDSQRYRTIRDMWRPDFIKRENVFLTAQQCRDNGYKYVVIHDLFSRYLFYPERFPMETSFHKDLVANATLVAEFAPQPFTIGLAQSRQRGGTVRIYKLKDSVVSCQ